jgi:hypothetical protein
MSIQLFFSKKYDHSFNPEDEFAVILTCSAQTKVALIAGAEKRISTPFDDPKAYDNTPLQKYTNEVEIAARIICFLSNKLNLWLQIIVLQRLNAKPKFLRPL